MKLVVNTPTAIVVDEEGIRYVRAEDASGSFGIEPRHADLLTTLSVCVVRWKDRIETQHYVAVRGGILRVKHGDLVEIATREAVVGDDLALLHDQVLSAMTKNLEAEESARAGAMHLERAAIRQIYRYLRPAEQPIKTRPQE
ncbi:MAG TPA: F0F1 ATP synthase subunit epsilon [Candidatus Binataceae bacterium]|nr:F0F1 ATP synthase subunit epsilon [Candidatus Binataceae bacterium]